MSTAVPHLDTQSVQPAISGDFRPRDFVGNGAGMPVLERLAETVAPAMQATAPARTPPPLAAAATDDLSARMQSLVQIEGGVSAIARRCGFAEDAVRDWCQGRSDISREHCIILARALGISPRWLIAGEGSMRARQAPAVPASVSRTASAASGDDVPPDHTEPEAQITVDPHLLATAFRVLQSYIGLVGGSLGPTQRADALAQIYHVLGHAGGPGHADRVIALHAALGGYFCSRKSLIG